MIAVDDDLALWSARQFEIVEEDIAWVVVPPSDNLDRGRERRQRGPEGPLLGRSPARAPRVAAARKTPTSLPDARSRRLRKSRTPKPGKRSP